MCKETIKLISENTLTADKKIVLLTTILKVDEINVPIDSDIIATKMHIETNIITLDSSIGCDVRGYAMTRYRRQKKIVAGARETNNAA